MINKIDWIEKSLQIVYDDVVSRIMCKTKDTFPKHVHDLILYL
jgi:hypothetical protein